MIGPVEFHPKPVEWVLERSRSWYVPTIEARVSKGEGVRAEIFKVGRDTFARVRFENPIRPDLVLYIDETMAAQSDVSATA